jgi:flagellar hook-length control protein FliK
MNGGIAMSGALPTLTDSAVAAAEDPAGAAPDAGDAPTLAESPAAAPPASAAAALAQTAASTQAGPASADTPTAVSTRPVSNATIAAPNRIEADTGTANAQGAVGSGSGNSPSIGGSLQSSVAAALATGQTMASDTAASSASKLQAAADSAPDVTAAQNPVLQTIAGSIEMSPAITVSAAMPAIADAGLALAGPGAKKENGADLGGNGNGNGDAAAAAQQVGSSAPSAASDAGATPTLKVNAALDSANFPQGLAERVSWVVDNNLNGAKLQVNPPQLGPIELQIAVQGDHAQVWMSTHSAVTRDALESSVPKLREMLGAQGFGDVRVDISQRSFQERSAYAPPYEWAPPSDRAETSAATASSAAARISLGAVDAYA